MHLTFLLLLAWIAMSYYQRGGAAAAVSGVLFTLLVFGCVVLHEFGHVAAAARYGIRTPDITLLPIGGVARLTRMPDEPRQEIIVALAGPAVNVVIAGVLMLAGAQPTLSPLTQLDGNAAIVDKLFATNLFLVLFNLLPAFPMDGGRVLRAVLALRMPHVRATHLAATVGQGFAFFFGFVGLFYNPILLFVALFVYLGAAQETAFVQMRNVTTGLPLSAAMMTDFRTLTPESSLSEAVQLLLGTAQHEFPVVEASGSVRGLLTRDAMIAALGRGHTGPVGTLALLQVPMLELGASLEDAFAEMVQCRCSALAVVGPDGRLVGLITTENVGELMMVQNALAKQPIAAGSDPATSLRRPA